MRVLFVTQYGPLGASSRTRVFQYLPILEAEGIETVVRTVIPDVWSTRLGHDGAVRRLLYYVFSFARTVWVAFWTVLFLGDYDRVVIQKVLFPGPIARLLKRCREKVVYDFDDAIFTTDTPLGLLGRLSGWRRGASLPRMLYASRVAIVENDYTKDYAGQFCDRVEIITGPIDTDRYSPRDSADAQQVILGWIGSQTTTAYLDRITDILDRVAEVRPNVRLRLIGARPVRTKRIETEARQWSLDTEVEDLTGCDVGLMPLPDDLWTRGKGGYKLLQYGAVGLPVVASPVGVNKEIVVDGETGFLVSDEEDWVSRLIELVDDPELRTRMGRAGRERMLQQFSLGHSSRKLIEILKLGLEETGRRQTVDSI